MSKAMTLVFIVMLVSVSLVEAARQQPVDTKVCIEIPSHALVSCMFGFLMYSLFCFWSILEYRRRDPGES